MDTCPFCGAKSIPEYESQCFECLTWKGTFGNYERSGKCKDRQISQLQAQVSDLEMQLDSEKDQANQYFEDIQACINKRLDLEKRLEAWHQHWKEDHGYETQWTAPLRQLKDLGEI